MKRASQIFLWLVLGLGSLTITLSSFVYFHPEERAPFIIEKLPLPAEDLYLWVLRIHVTAAALALPGCLILTSKTILKRWQKFHRCCGRLIGMLVLWALAPSGFYLAFFAKGGWGGTLGFLLSGVIVMTAMIYAIRTARAKQYAAHRRFTFHVLGQLSVAVSSRAMLYLLESANLNADFAYLVSLWIPVVGTFGLVEFFVSSNPFPSFLRRIYEQTIPAVSAAPRGGAKLR